MFNARYIQKGEIIDYTPADDVAAGEIVFLGDICGVTKIPIAKNKLGALAITGVYEVSQDAAAVTAGTKLYWDATGKKAVTTATDETKYLGICAVTTASTDTRIRVVINVGTGDAPASGTP